MFCGKIAFLFFLGLKRAGLFLENVALVIGRSVSVRVKCSEQNQSMANNT